MAAISGNWLSYNSESAETDASGWGGSSNVNCTIAQSTTHALDGTHSLLMTSSASGAMSTRTAAAVAIPSGAKYVSFGAGVYSSNGLTCTVTLQWLDSSNSILTTTVTPNLTGSAAWTYAHSGVTIPTGAASVNVILGATATAASQQVFWDRMWVVTQPPWPDQLLTLDAEFNETPSPQWTATVNCSASCGPVGTYIGGYGTSLQLTAAAAGDMQATPNAGAVTVTAGSEYMATAWMAQASGASRAAEIELRWLASDGVTVVSSSVFSRSTASGAWTRCSVIGICPSGASKALIVLRPQAGAASEVWYADQIGLVPTAPSDYLLSGNLLGYNGQSVEMDISAWTAVSGCTISQSSAHAYNGTYAVAVNCTGGDATIQLANPVAVSPGQAYQFQPGEYPAVMTGTHSLVLQWLDSSGNIVKSSTTDSTFASGSSPGWYITSAADLCPATATHLQVQYVIRAATNGDVWYIDQVYVGPGGLAASAAELAGQYAAQVSIQGLTTEKQTTYDVERMMPDGTLVPVRGQSGDLIGQTIVGNLAVVTDYEAPLGVPVRWYVRTYGASAGGSLSYTTDPLTLTEPDQNHMVIKDPSLPARNMTAMVGTPPDWQRKAAQGIYQPRGSSTPIIRYDVRQSRTGTLTLATWTDADRQQMAWLLATGNTLLLQAAHGLGWDDVYVQVGDVAEPRFSTLASEPGRTWTLPLTEVARPVGGIAGSAGRTWQDVLNGYSTWRDVYNAYSSWLGVLTGVGGT